jgi:RNA polymerase sigma factor (sigma-70 family)
MVEWNAAVVAEASMRNRPVGDDARGRAFAGLVTRGALDSAYRYATLILGNRADAEDATHDAAVTAWRRFGDLRDPARFDAWFGRILVNTCRDRMRARRNIVHEIDLAETVVEGSDPADVVGRRHVLAAALRTLSLEHREVVVLRYFNDLTVDQIAVRTGAGAGTVKSRLHYALRRLRDAMGTDQEGDVR